MAARGLKVLKGHWVGAISLVLINALGLLTLSSADSYSGDSFLRPQLVWTLVGYLVALAAAFIDIRIVERYAYFFYGIIMFLLAITPLVGTTINNSRRWIIIGNQQMQPSEFMKLAVVLALAKLLQRTKGPEPFTLRTLIRPGLIIGVPFLFVLGQPDLGTGLIIAFIGTSMLLLEGIRARTLAFLVAGALVVVPLAWHFDWMHGYQKDRVRLWLSSEELDPRNPEHKRILDKNLQTEQALWAIGSGQLAGKGIRGGAQSRLKHLPEMQNDFIIAIFGEEHGFVGCIALAVLYWIVVVWALGVARRAKERFYSMVAVGFAAIIFWHFFVNVGMVTGVLPVVGVPLPLMSYGGSAALTNLTAFGLLLNVATTKVRIN
jgi:rod shape determining protein RodA